jgi:glycine/D-amino acid oxidase-like deaminating enzyme
VRPDASGGLLIGASDLDALVNETTPPGSLIDVAKPLLDRAARAFPPAREVRLVDARVGIRPMPADGHTIAGRLPRLENAWVVATHSGVTLGALLGGLIADEVLGKPPHPDLAPFRPDRFVTS